MDKCREEFDHWAKNNGLQNMLGRCIYDVEFTDTNTQFAFIGFEGAFKHQQAKVEGLQKRVDTQQKLLGIYRVLAEDQLDNCADNLIAKINELEQALKGEG